MMFFAQFLEDQSGATAIEYGLIAAGISVAIIVVARSHIRSESLIARRQPALMPSLRSL